MVRMLLRTSLTQTTWCGSIQPWCLLVLFHRSSSICVFWSMCLCMTSWKRIARAKDSKERCCWTAQARASATCMMMHLSAGASFISPYTWQSKPCCWGGFIEATHGAVARFRVGPGMCERPYMSTTTSTTWSIDTPVYTYTYLYGRGTCRPARLQAS